MITTKTNNSKIIPIQVNSADIEVIKSASDYDNQKIEERIIDQDNEISIIKVIGQTSFLAGLQVASIGFNLFPISCCVGIAGFNLLSSLPCIRINREGIKILDHERLKFAACRQIALSTIAAKAALDSNKAQQQANTSFEIYVNQEKQYKGEKQQPDWISIVMIAGIALLFIGAIKFARRKS